MPYLYTIVVTLSCQNVLIFVSLRAVGAIVWIVYMRTQVSVNVGLFS
jgi:hypothetical protein